MKIKWLVTDVTPVGSPDRAERAILVMIFGIFWADSGPFVIGEPLCDVESPSRALHNRFSRQDRTYHEWHFRALEIDTLANKFAMKYFCSPIQAK